MSGTEKIAIYGLGNMGYLVAERLAKHFSLQVSDLDQNTTYKAKKFLEAEVVENSEQLAQTKFVVLCLPNPKASLAVLSQIASKLPKGSVIIETSTVNPQDIKNSYDFLQKYNVDIIDASLLAGVSQMQAGTATLLIGGERKVIRKCKPILDAIATKQIIFGDLGTGAAAKVINNAVAHSVMVVVTEAASMATTTGVSLEKLIQLLSDPQMGLHRPLTFRLAEKIVNNDYIAGMPLDAARKDSCLALELAQDNAVPLFAIQACHSVYEMAGASGYDRDDYAAIAKLWSDWKVPIVPE